MYSLFLRNLAMPSLLRLTHSRYWQHYRQMLKLDRQPAEVVERVQWQRLLEIIEHAYHHVPYYRDAWNSAGICPAGVKSREDFLRIPITTKKALQENFPDRVTARGIDPSEWRYVSTRGTANRLIVVQDFYKRDVARGAALRSLEQSGGCRIGHRISEIPPDACNVTCGDEGQPNDGVLPHLWQMVRNRQIREPAAISDLRGLVERHWVLRKKTYPPFGADGTNPSPDRLRSYVNGLRKDRPFLLRALPTYLLQISRYIQQHGEQPLKVAIVKPVGASVSPQMRKIIERGFRGNYHEDYGSAELGPIAGDCRNRDGLHVYSDLFYVEVLRDGMPVPDGQPGKVVITDLFNKAMPIIRYEIGDIGRMNRQPCGCGRSSPKLIVDGRVEDCLVTSNGDIFSSDQVMDFFYGRDDVDQFQLVQQNDGRLDMTIVPFNGMTPDLKKLAAELTNWLGDDVPVRSFTAKTIRPETSGKFRFVKSASYEQLR